MIPSMWILAAAAVAAWGAASPAPEPTPQPEQAGQVAIELVVEDARSRTVTNLAPNEVEIEQEGVRQSILSLRFLADKGWYEVRYAPHSGRVGAVSVRVTRGGTRLRGPHGPAVKPRWIPPVAAFEAPLRAALEAPAAAGDLAYEIGLLRFEARGDTLHHTVLAEVPLRQVSLERAGERGRAHLAFFLRAKAADGRIVHEGSLEQSLDVDTPAAGSDDVQRFVWSSHVHLGPGRYVVEVAAMDRRTARLGVRRLDLHVEPPSPALRVSSLTFLLARGGLMAGEEEDNPLRFEDGALVPLLRPRWVAGSEGQLSFLAVVYPQPGSTEPVTAAVELHRDGQLRAQAAVPLPPPTPDGHVRYVGGMKFSALQPGAYIVKLVARQGAMRAEEAAAMEVVPPPRLKE